MVDDVNLQKQYTLLDYYTELCTSHLSIFVACIMGIIGVRALELEFQRAIIAYVILSTGGIYSIMKYVYYNQVCNYILNDIGAYDSKKFFNNKRYSYERYALIDLKGSNFLKCVYCLLHNLWSKKWFFVSTVIVYIILIIILIIPQNEMIKLLEIVNLLNINFSLYLLISSISFIIGLMVYCIYIDKNKLPRRE